MTIKAICKHPRFDIVVEMEFDNAEKKTAVDCLQLFLRMGFEVQLKAIKGGDELD